MIFTFIPDPRDAQEAAFQARIMSRALALETNGYRIYDRGERNPDCSTLQGLYFVHSPEGALYEVDTNANECECACCQENKFCKHLIACALKEEKKREEAQVAELEEYARRNGLTD